MGSRYFNWQLPLVTCRRYWTVLVGGPMNWPLLYGKRADRMLLLYSSDPVFPWVRTGRISVGNATGQKI